MLRTTLRRASLRSNFHSKCCYILHSTNVSRHSSTTLLSRPDSGVEQPAPTAVSGAETNKAPTNEDKLTDESSSFCRDSPPTSQTKLPKKAGKTRSKRDSSTPTAKKPKFLNAPPQKIEAFLHKLESEVDTLNLEDVERFRPRTVTDTLSPGYEDDYNDVANNLVQSFNLSQLRRIFTLYSIPNLAVSLQRKNLYVQTILEHWGWKPISVVREDISDVTETSELRLPLTSEEAFLLLGKEGVELLNLAKRYGVSLSFTDHPLNLKAKGLQGSLKRLRGYLNSFKKDIQVEIASLHLRQTLSFETVKLISRLSGAHIMPVDDDKFRITFHRSQPRSLDIAKRMSMQAASRTCTDITQPIMLATGLSISENSDSDSSPYSLYPFTPHQQLAWEFSSMSSFRLRRVGHWLDTMQPSSSNHGATQIFGSSSGLKSRLTSNLSHSTTQSEATLAISACTGHFLFLSPSQGKSLAPPVVGQRSIDDVLEWARISPELITFNNSIPTTISTTPAHKEQYVRKLTYVEQVKGDPNTARTLHIEIPWTPENGEQNMAPDYAPRFYISAKSGINFLIPDRLLDLQLSAASTYDIPVEDLPRELSTFVAAKESGSPDSHAPLFTFTSNGDEYALSSDERIHREFKTVNLSNKDVDIVTEILIDVDINRHKAVCKITCENHQSQESLDAFLDTCSIITTAS